MISYIVTAITKPVCLKFKVIIKSLAKINTTITDTKFIYGKKWVIF